MGIDSYTALLLMQNLLRILHYLKSRNIIHNDIKGTELLLLMMVVVVVVMVVMILSMTTLPPTMMNGGWQSDFIF